MLSALYAITSPSVYLSVCLSVTRVDQSKMAEVRVTQFSAYYPSSFCLVSFIQKFWRVPMIGRSNKEGVWKRAIGDIGFYAYCGHESDILGSRNVVGHMTIRLGIGHFLLVVLWNQAFISTVFCHIQWRMWGIGRRDLKQPLNKVQGHSFWYQSIPHIRLPICAVNSNFCSRMHRLATIHTLQTTDK